MKGARLALCLLASAISACAGAARTDQLASAAPVIAAERAFAARASEMGWVRAFRDFTAPDGQMAQHAFVSAPEALAAMEDDGDRSLFWWPDYAGMARSGDLGFTTGGYSVDAARTPRGQYFTVWRRQPDGSWKWIFDGGPGGVADPPPFVGGAPAIAELSFAEAGVGDAARAAAEVDAIERGAGDTFARYLAADGHVYRRGRARAAGGEASLANFTFPSAGVAYRLARTEASAAGDLVFTLGEADWRENGEAKHAFFARIWQHRPEGWRIVYDQLMARAPPPAS